MSHFRIFVAAILAAIVLAIGVVPAGAAFPDQATWAGTSGGSANAQTLTVANYSSRLVGVPIRFIPGYTNTGAMTLTISYQGGSTTAGTVYKTTSAGLVALSGGEIVASQAATVMWDGSHYVLAGPAPQLVGGFQKLVVTATSNTQVTVTADALAVANSDGYGFRVPSVSITCTITTAGLNGLDTGSEASSTWYSVWDVFNPGTQTNGCLLSASATSPTLPAGYTAKARVGWVRNDASANFWRTVQYGDLAQIIQGTNPTVLPRMATGPSGSPTTPTWVAVVLSAYAPPTAAAVRVSLSCTSCTAAVVPNNTYGAIDSTTNPPLMQMRLDAGFGNVTTAVPVLIAVESSNIYWAANNSGALLAAFGWQDNL